MTLVLFALSASASILGACKDDSEMTPGTEDAGPNGGSLERAACPADLPNDGSPCFLPEGTTCDIGQCGTRIAQCTRGAWKIATNPATPCPALPPPADVACPPCWPALARCFYGSTNCAAEDASDNVAIASCASGRWVVDVRPCRDSGGPDVQDGGD